MSTKDPESGGVGDDEEGAGGVGPRVREGRKSRTDTPVKSHSGAKVG